MKPSFENTRPNPRAAHAGETSQLLTMRVEGKHQHLDEWRLTILKINLADNTIPSQTAVSTLSGRSPNLARVLRCLDIDSSVSAFSD